MKSDGTMTGEILIITYEYNLIYFNKRCKWVLFF